MIANDDTPTGTCALIINHLHRSLVANLAACNKYNTEHLHRAEIAKLVDTAEYFYIGGFFFTVSPESIMHLCHHAAEKNKVREVYLDTAYRAALTPPFDV